MVGELNNQNTNRGICLITTYLLVIYAGRKLEHNFIKMSNKFTTFIFFSYLCRKITKKKLKYGRKQQFFW